MAAKQVGLLHVAAAHNPGAPPERATVLSVEQCVCEILTIKWQILSHFLYFLFLKRISQVCERVINVINIDFPPLKREKKKFGFVTNGKKMITHTQPSIQPRGERPQHHKTLEASKTNQLRMWERKALPYPRLEDSVTTMARVCLLRRVGTLDSHRS